VPDPAPVFLLKLSGEALGGDTGQGVDAEALSYFHSQIAEAAASGARLALVIGGGNFLRGAQLAAAGTDRVRGDHMGMLATVMNGLALSDRLQAGGLKSRLMSAFSIDLGIQTWDRDAALQALSAGEVLVLAGGTGNPFFSTDTAAVLRAAELGAGLLVKATKVDGVYSADPVQNSSATRYDVLSYDECLARRLAVMDATAIALARDNELPLRVLDVHQPGNLAAVVRGEAIGTLVNGTGTA
jgi:uridylate kinase